MPIPLQSEMFRLVLDQYSNEKEYSRREMKDKMLPTLILTDDEKKHKTSSGVPVYESRVGWAVTHLHKAAYLQRVQRGTYKITEEGKTALANYPRYDEFYKAMYRNEEWMSLQDEVSEDPESVQDISPDEMISIGESKLRQQLASDLMDAIMEIPGREGDIFFEKVVTDLLVHMGYGKGISARRLSSY
ncbi:MAG: hypothetical protein FWD27_07930 [Coriobacteriia bacterium]|nr:hypothetical protein [Coriobacteriia bacterium]